MSIYVVGNKEMLFSSGTSKKNTFMGSTLRMIDWRTVKKNGGGTQNERRGGVWR